MTTKQPEMVVQWITDVASAPPNTLHVAWTQGGINTGYVDDVGQWRSRSGRPVQTPKAWMPAFDGPPRKKRELYT